MTFSLATSLLRGILMKKLAMGFVAAVALIGTPAFAADLNKPVYKAPPPARPAPVYNWTGWYVGANWGLRVGQFERFDDGGVSRGLLRLD
jgi:opacity protein-like surface antigen